MFGFLEPERETAPLLFASARLFRKAGHIMLAFITILYASSFSLISRIAFTRSRDGHFGGASTATMRAATRSSWSAILADLRDSSRRFHVAVLLRPPRRVEGRRRRQRRAEGFSPSRHDDLSGARAPIAFWCDFTTRLGLALPFMSKSA